jgi:hypothetical protein
LLHVVIVFATFVLGCGGRHPAEEATPPAETWPSPVDSTVMDTSGAPADSMMSPFDGPEETDEIRVPPVQPLPEDTGSRRR